MKAEMYIKKPSQFTDSPNGEEFQAMRNKCVLVVVIDREVLLAS
jgi:hypothetical protein